MENLYNYVFWYNPYEETWYAIETKNYVEFMSDSTKRDNTLKSSKVETLIEMISKEVTIV